MALFRGLFNFFLDDSKLDEKIGMTERQKRLVQNTWAIARKDEVSAGLAIMIAVINLCKLLIHINLRLTCCMLLFKQYPEYQKQFKSFKDVPIDELPKNKRFQAHCANIISTFGKLIEQMYDPELMQASLTNLIEKHKTRGQTQEQFENLKQLLISLFPSLFGKQYTPEAQEAWKKMLDLIFSSIYEIYKN